jgi:[acyl-carrier-protein] S-malonyltransferase
MGRDLVDAYPPARDLFAKADEVMGFPLSRICFHGPSEVLTQTAYAQPAILTVSLACLRILRDRLPNLQPAMVAGHSLGEFSALVAAGALSFEEAISLVHERGKLMAEAGKRSPGGMAAILGLDEQTMGRICQEAIRSGGTVQIANINAPSQIVISGDQAGLKHATDLALARGGTRVIPLAVSIAPHSPLMETIVEAFRDEVRKVHLRAPLIPVIGNVTGQPLSGPSEIRQELDRQLTSPVRWVESIGYMIAAGITSFVEVGPGTVLRGLLRRINSSVEAVSVSDKKSIGALVGDFKGSGF